ncbi:hypothetical protein V5F73_26195, partial [Xanthobacter flavus]
SGFAGITREEAGRRPVRPPPMPGQVVPLIMSFQKFCGLASDQVHGSRLGEITEASYRSPDMDRARSTEA